MTHRSALLLAIAVLIGASHAAVAAAPPMSRDAVLAETLKPYEGPSVRQVETSTLAGKVLCGYQGWFNCEGDGANRGWTHWTSARGAPQPRNIRVDLWPDVSELGSEERFATQFRLSQDRPAELFSSFKRETVLRHFKWMQDYGIDGAFVQRFVGGLRNPYVLRHNNTVLGHCREGANRSGRAYVVMYDLSGLGANRITDVMEDWRALRTRMRIADDPAYLRHRGQPVVAVWGVGFPDRHTPTTYSLADCRTLVDFLKHDKEAGNCAVMLGVPTGWRLLQRDSVTNAVLHDIIKAADIVSPWTVGRYGKLDQIPPHAEKFWKPDGDWCRANRLDYLPVVFPGFSWHNMKSGPLDQIPRRGGRFLWSQFCEAKRAGAQMIYVAMFDEVDEGTAIFKCANDVPTGAGFGFVTYEGLPSDHYLKLTGLGAKLLRGEIPLTDSPPAWKP